MAEALFFIRRLAQYDSENKALRELEEDILRKQLLGKSKCPKMTVLDLTQKIRILGKGLDTMNHTNIFNWLLFGGHDRKAFDEIKEGLYQTNRTRLITFSMFFSGACFIMTLLSFLVPNIASMRYVYITYLAIMLIILFVTKQCGERESLLLYMMYLFVAIVLSFGILIGTLSPKEISATYIALLLTTPQLFADKTYRMHGLTMIMDVIFVFMVVMHKDPITWSSDIINALIFSLVSMLLSTFNTNTRVSRFLMEERVRELTEVDQLTKLYNRRAYEMDINSPAVKQENMVYVSIDVNELKVINDSLGHEAGDELLAGAAGCMKQCFGPYGRIYRTGGDEFIAILHVSEEQLEHIKKDFEDTLFSWSGKLVDSVSASCGYVSRKEFADLSIYEIAKLADARMYQVKAAWYKNKGKDRRGQAAAHTALCNLYTKILKINLTTDTYSIVDMDLSEQTTEKGFTNTISGWLQGFGKSGQVHEDDLDKYLKNTDLEFLKDYFKSGKTSISIFYRRKYAEEFKRVAMEMIPADDYEENNQALFLYVKKIDI